MTQIIKPFGVPVEAAFQRIKIMVNLMEYFPPPCSKGKQPTRAHWAMFNANKRLTNENKREIKYNLLPPFFQECMDNLEGDWTKWDNIKFLSQVQKCKVANHCEQKHCSNKRKGF